METTRRGRRLWVLGVAGAALAALAGLLYVLVFRPTVLQVRVIDAETGKPLPGVLVTARLPGAQPLPTKTTDEEGIARFEEPLAAGAYRLEIQKADFGLGTAEAVEVRDGRETEATVPLAPQAGGRLYVGLRGSRIVEIDTASLLTMGTFMLGAEEWEWVKNLTHHPSESYLYCTTHQTGFILDSETGATLKPLQIAEPVRNLYLCDDGRYLLAEGVWSREAILLDAHSGERLPPQMLEDAGIDPYDYAFSRSLGSRRYTLVLRLPDGTLTKETWDSLIQHLVQGERVHGMLTGADGRSTLYPAPRVLAATNGHTLYAWTQDRYEPERRVELHVVQAHEVPAVHTYHLVPFGVSAVAVSPTQPEVYTLDAELCTLAIINVVDQEPRKLVPVGKEPIALVVSDDGEKVYVANNESQTVSVVHLPTQHVSYTVPLPGKPVSIALR